MINKAMQNLVDLISANRKDIKFKQALLPALGELIYLISCQVKKNLKINLILNQFKCSL